MADLTLAQILTLLTDNNLGQISAQDVQDVVTALFERTDGTNEIPALQFSVTVGPPNHSAGMLHWSETSDTLEMDSSTPGVSLQFGQEQWVEARNQSGSTILDGTPVKQVGASGNRPLIGVDDGMGEIIGIATHDIASGSNGKVTSFGLVRNLDTSSLSAGDGIYVDGSGSYTTDATPSFAGIVVNPHATQGTILARPNRRGGEAGTTAQRPASAFIGFSFFDTTLGKPIWWDGSQWLDAVETVV